MRGIGMALYKPESTSLRGSHAPRVLTKQSPYYEVQSGKSVFERDWFALSAGLCFCSLTVGDAFAGSEVVVKKFVGLQ
ncbi:MAG TPA: hypothetical protein VJ184_12535 [Chryseolinea sp.]|nr:hypothetical protein [Chryseolinea sp.]